MFYVLTYINSTVGANSLRGAIPAPNIAYTESAPVSCQASIVLISVKVCARKPCLNGGTCVEDDHAGYSCNCPDHYIGRNCEFGTSLTILYRICWSQNDVAYLNSIIKINII